MTSDFTPTPAPVKKTPVRKKAAKTEAPAGTAGDAANKPAKKPARSKLKAAALQADERRHLIEVAAYYLAERREFPGSTSHDDWLQAEREIDAMIAAGKFA